jgi:membrane protease YdiL (CAAX protease family)
VRFVRGIAIAAAVALASLAVEDLAAMPPDGFVPGSFVTHTFMLAASILIIWLWPGRSFSDFGFTTGTYRFRPGILLWALPTAALSLLGALASRTGGVPSVVAERSYLQLILFVWVYASLCEEVLVRGLLQSLLGKRRAGSRGSPAFAMPIVVSALFFGAMHLVLVDSMGPAAAVPIALATLLGYVAARYRESTGSVIPAVIIHVLFNVGGMLPGWIVGWFGS